MTIAQTTDTRTRYATYTVQAGRPRQEQAIPPQSPTATQQPTDTTTHSMELPKLMDAMRQTQLQRQSPARQVIPETTGEPETGLSAPAANRTATGLSPQQEEIGPRTPANEPPAGLSSRIPVAERQVTYMSKTAISTTVNRTQNPAVDLIA